MKKTVIASTGRNAGKTNVILGLIKASGKDVGYLKPLGDRLLYKKKRQWDYDSAAIVSLCGLDENPEQISIGFDHSKLRYMYDESGIEEKMGELISEVGANRDAILFECGCNLSYGMSVRLDPVSVTKLVEGNLVVVVSGSDDVIVDEIMFVQRYLQGTGVKLVGVIINKVRDLSDFETTHLPTIKDLGISVLGVIPFAEEFTYFSVSYLADKMFGKVLAGEEGLSKVVKHIVVGAMSADAVMRTPVFAAESKLVITSGDRSDMILASLETNASAVVLTNNIIPPANIISMAREKGIPLILVNGDTYATAKQIDDMDPLTTKDSTRRAELITDLVKNNVRIDQII